VKKYLYAEFNTDIVDKFWNEQGDRLQAELVDETNKRIEVRASLRYEILDDIAERIRGAGYCTPSDPRSTFQNALHELKPIEFERLAGVLLKWAGCHQAWLTPQSHDQGLDAFGYYDFFSVSSDWLCGKPRVVFFAQAKHYKKNRVSSYELREFIGATECAKHSAYAVKGKKYLELDIPPFMPIALMFLTSGEVKVTAKTLARNTGIVLVASDELFVICEHYWQKSGVKFPRTKCAYLSKLRKAGTGFPISK
jgi:hypothetical protein